MRAAVSVRGKTLDVLQALLDDPQSVAVVATQGRVASLQHMLRDCGVDPSGRVVCCAVAERFLRGRRVSCVHVDDLDDVLRVFFGPVRFGTVTWGQ